MAEELKYPGAPKDWPQIQVLRRIWRAGFKLKTLHQPHFRDIDMDMVDFDVLATLGNTNGMTMNELTETVISVPSDVTEVCAAMEGRGLVRRRRSDDGGRDFIVELTAKGDELFRATFPKTVNCSAEILDTALSEPELKSLARLLDKLIDAVTLPEPK